MNEFLDIEDLADSRSEEPAKVARMLTRKECKLYLDLGKSEDPIVYAECRMFSTRPSTAAAESVPMICMICCFQGVAPTRCPVFKSCRLSPPMAAAQHTTAPIIIALAAPSGDPAPRMINNSKDENRIVAMVTPETGLFDDPTMPAM